jgi:transcriptional regulator with XRE-family HTH domain
MKPKVTIRYEWSNLNRPGAPMSIATDYRLRRRRRIHRLRADGATVAAIAERLGVAISTVKRDLKAEPPPPPYQAVDRLRSDAAVTHGAFSETALAPLREKHGDRLRQRFSAVTEERLSLIATLFARIDLANAWMDERGIVRDDVAGELYPIARDADRTRSREFHVRP